MTWDEHVSAWSHPPVDDVGYLSSRDMLDWDDARLHKMIHTMHDVRYNGWRNHNGLWRDLMGLDTTTGKDILDFGCGVGIEALELHNAGNRVSVADISGDNIALAIRVMQLCGDPVPGTITGYLVDADPPYIYAGECGFDVIHCNGVLHHIPWARQIMERFHDLLRPGGQVRLMVYSDEGWRIYTGTEPPPVPWMTSHPKFETFVRAFDSVGSYAEWYDENKIRNRFGDLFTVDRFAYLTPNRRYCAAVLTKKDL